MKAVQVLVLTGYGLNCDNETAYAFELAGATAHRVHINAVIEGAVKLSRFQILVFGGGFSWGDDHGAGVVQAVRMQTNIGDDLFAFIQKGNLIIGICNGFQTLVNMGLLPGFNLDGPNGDRAQRCLAVTYNDCGNFRDQWVKLRVNPASACIYTRGLTEFELPVRHGEGKCYCDEETLNKLVQNEQIAIQYAGPDGRPARQVFPHNPNGSILDIAGLSDPSGRIFGLMPHPEAFNHWTNHPDWPLMKERLRRKGLNFPSELTPGVKMLANAVDYFK
jgi:phosphoribosylformylglycinamidine synthase